MPYFLAGTLLCLLPGRASRYVKALPCLACWRLPSSITAKRHRFPAIMHAIFGIIIRATFASSMRSRRIRSPIRVGRLLARATIHSVVSQWTSGPSNSCSSGQHIAHETLPLVENAHWYFETPGGGPAPRYQFILVTEGLGTWTPSRKEVIKRFGEPASVITFANGGMYALIYTRPCDVEFQEIAEHEFHFIREKFRFQVGEKVGFPAHALPSLLLGSSPPHERTAIEGCVPAGQLSSGPFMHFREAGTYRVTVASSSSDSEELIAGWQLFMLHPNGVPSFTASGPIDNGTEMLTVRK